jgi:Rrf2 family protein
MKISARSRYATRILIDLAMNEEDAPVRTTSISERTGITVQFIEQILKPLRQAELVTSKRGATGGYHLNKPASELSLGEIIRIMEGPLALTDCCDDADLCNRSGSCLTRAAWRRVSAVLANALDSIKLFDIIDGLPPQCEELKDEMDEDEAPPVC